MVVDWVPPESPYASLHWYICQRLSYVPSVPQENVLIIAGTVQQLAHRKAHAHLLPETLTSKYLLSAIPLSHSETGSHDIALAALEIYTDKARLKLKETHLSLPP